MAPDAAFDADGIIACIYVFGGGLSMLLCLLVLFCFAGTPAISRFPASMMGWRLVCDTILSAQARGSSPCLLYFSPSRSAALDRPLTRAKKIVLRRRALAVCAAQCASHDGAAGERRLLGRLGPLRRVDVLPDPRIPRAERHVRLSLVVCLPLVCELPGSNAHLQWPPAAARCCPLLLLTTVASRSPSPLSFDLYFSVTRPFTRPSSRLGAYQLWVWAGSALTGIVAAARFGYRPLYHVCWTTRAEPNEELWVGSMMGLFFGWLVAYSLLSIAVLIHVQSQLLVGGEDLRRRLLPRLTSVNASRMYTAAFSAYWAAVGVVYAWLYVRYEVMGVDSSTDRQTSMRALFSLLLSLLGSWDAAVWFIVQRHCYPEALKLCCSPMRKAVRKLSSPGWLWSAKWPSSRYRRTLTDSDFGSTPSVCEVSSDERSSNGSPGLTEALGGTPYAGRNGTPYAKPLKEPKAEPPVGSPIGGEAGDISDVLRREFVRQTIVGIVTSTRAVNAEAACAAPVFNSAGSSSFKRSASGGRLASNPRSPRTTAAIASAMFGGDASGMHPTEIDGRVHAELSKLHTPLLAEQYVAERPAGRAPSAPAAQHRRTGSGGHTTDERDWSEVMNHLHAYPAGEAGPPDFCASGGGRSATAGDSWSRGGGGSGGAGSGTAARGGPTASVDPMIRHLTPSHFSEVSTLELGEGVYFQDFAPMVWQALRQSVYQLPFTQYLQSLMGDSAGQMAAYIETMVGNFSEGGSGGFFFLSPDRRYLIKTLTRAEQKVLLRMLPKYYEYLRTSPRTLLCRFYGCYAITMHGQTVCFVAMESLFHSAQQIHEKYDLKGSWVDRSTSRGGGPSSHREPKQSGEEGGAEAQQTPMRPRAEAKADPPTRKDNDLTRKLPLPPVTAAALRRQCASDAELLRSLNVMDYSLLVGVHHPSLVSATYSSCTISAAPQSSALRADDDLDASGPTSPPPAAREAEAPTRAPPISAALSPRLGAAREAKAGRDSPLTFASDEEGGAIYYIGIIDLLQTWTLAKRLERFFKIALCCRCGTAAAGMSAVEPRQYASRFLRMIDRILKEW